ncbi:MAG: hypothetical protein Fur0041_01130 [Bacteroidia bacterium]
MLWDTKQDKTMKKTFITAIATLSCGILFCQEQPAQPQQEYKSNSHQGTFRTQATITPSWQVGFLTSKGSYLANSGRTNIYIHGTAEYYFTDRFSMRGDAYYFVNKNNVEGGWKHNHSLEIGGSWHLIKEKNIDPYLGLRAGASYTQTYPYSYAMSSSVTWTNYPVTDHINPVAGPHAGINFFGEKFFHFFVEAHYLMGTHRPLYGPVSTLNEVRVSAGLGWNWSFFENKSSVRPTI